MRSSLLDRPVRLAVTLLVMASMAMLGMVRPPAGAPLAAEMALARYALPDGSLPELCSAPGQDRDQRTPVGSDHQAVCALACALAALTGVVPAAPAPVPPIAFAWRVAPPAAPVDAPRTRWQGAQARAPPLAG